MSRVAKKPVSLPTGVELTQAADSVKVKGPKGELSLALNPEVEIQLDEGSAMVGPRSGSRFAVAMAGTTRVRSAGRARVKKTSRWPSLAS